MLFIVGQGEHQVDPVDPHQPHTERVELGAEFGAVGPTEHRHPGDTAAVDSPPGVQLGREGHGAASALSGPALGFSRLRLSITPPATPVRSSQARRSVTR